MNILDFNFWLLYELFHGIYHFSVEDAVIFWEFCTIIKTNNAERWSDLSRGLDKKGKDERNENENGRWRDLKVW